jgi:phosphonate transport system substrate-binding protein
MVAYVVNTAMLRRAGLYPGDYAEVFAKNPPNAAIGVYFGHADAAGIGDAGLKMPLFKQKGMDISKLKLIAKSEPLPHLPWAVNGAMPESLKLRIQRILLKLNDTPEGRSILEHAKLTGLRIATDKEYDKHRLILQEVENSGH